MNRSKLEGWTRAVIGMALLLVVLFSGLQHVGGAAPGAYRAPVDAAVEQAVSAQGKTAFVAQLKERADLSGAAAIRDWGERGRYVYDALTRTAATSQAGLIRRLKQDGVDYRSHWIVNAVVVNGDAATLDWLSRETRVERITALPENRPVEDASLASQPAAMQAAEAAPQAPDALPWNLSFIGADRVWRDYGIQGQGIVVASIGGMPQFFHPALLRNFRGSADGTLADRLELAYNYRGHFCWPASNRCDLTSGTRSLSVMTGGAPGGSLGVAPEARWIAAQTGYDDYWGYTRWDAEEWLVAPTDAEGQNPRPELRPHVINTYAGPFDFWVQEAAIFVAAGIFPAVAASDTGPECGSIPYYLAADDQAYLSGAFGPGGALAHFSGRGYAPGTVPDLKPNLVAPGATIRTAAGADGYETTAGTLLSSAHTAGVVALLWSARPDLIGDIAATRALLDQTAASVPAPDCGPYPSADLRDPNPHWGEGRLDAYAAVSLALDGQSGELHGMVRVAGSGDPLAGAIVELATPGARRTATAADGSFSIGGLPNGQFSLSVSHARYQTASLTVTIAGSVAQDVSLIPIVYVPQMGVVRTLQGEPVFHARVRLAGGAAPEVYTDADGRFSFPEIPAGAQTLAVYAGGCYTGLEAPFTAGPGAAPLLLRLDTRQDDFGYTCRNTPPETVTPRQILSPGDSGILVLPFRFPFYDRSVTRAFVWSFKGILNFAPPVDSSQNTALPSPGGPDGAVYAFWDDLLAGFPVDGPARVRAGQAGAM